jgi:hypothetical protein
MRRLLSLILLAAFVLPVVAPALALGQDPDASLPACCRRHGKHHCAMLAATLSRAHSGPQIGAVCPFYPQHLVAPVTGAHLIGYSSSQRTLIFAFVLAPAVRARTHRRIARERSRPKRGPPTELL